MEQKQSHDSDQSLERKQCPTDDPPFISQCQDFFEGGPEASQIFHSCKKNPKHPTFIPVKEFNKSYLPEEYSSDARMQRIRDCCDRTVRVIVKYTSLDRPDTYPNINAPYPYCEQRGNKRISRTGTGFVSLLTEWITPRHLSGVICPCHLCRESEDPKTEYHQLIVSTAAHVVFDHSEAEQTIFELFYDSEEDKEKIMNLYGVRLFADRGYRQRCEEDRVEVLCVTHEKVDQLFPPFGKRVEVPVSDKSFGVLISHPHGWSKHITVGNFLKREAPVPSVCRESSKKERHVTWFTRNFVKDKTSSDDKSEFINFNYRPEYVYGCRLPLDAKEPPEELCNLEQRHKTNNHKVYRLKQGVSFSIPFDAPFLCQDVKFGEGWYKFPTGTKISSEISNKKFVLPDMEFSMDPGQTRKVYSIDTCQGCSGAPVIWALTPDTAPVITHSGALKDGTNRSVLHYV